MARQAIPEELDILIREYLTDGIITAKERQVLLRKAQSLGLDVDEVDLYIDAQQQKADQAVDAAVKKQRGQNCPFCGGSIPQLTDKCPHCGQTITVQASDDLKEIIENLEDALVDFKSGKDFAVNKAKVEKYMRKAELYYSNNPKIKVLLDKVNNEVAVAEKNKSSNDRKAWISKNMLYIIFGILIFIEVIMAILAKSSAAKHLSDYHNYIGSRSDTYAQYDGANASFGWWIFAIIVTVVCFIIFVSKRKKK